MKALYAWLEDELGNNLVKFVKENKTKKAHVVRAALANYLIKRGTENGTGDKSKGVEEPIPGIAVEEQPAS